MKKYSYGSVLALLLFALPLAVQASTLDVMVTSGGFSPSTLTIAAGDTVRWTNTDSVNHNVSSNDHPTHLLYSSLNLGDFGPTQTRSLMFPSAGIYGYHDHNNPGLAGSITVQASAASPGGSAARPSSASMLIPNGGEILDAGSVYDIFWQADGSGLTGIRVSLSLDGGTTYSVIADNQFHDGIYAWTVSNTPSTAARFKIDALASGGSVLASDASDGDIMIRGTAAPAPTPTEPQQPQPPSLPPPPSASTAPEDTTRTGTYTPTAAKAANPTVDADKELPLAPDGTASCVAGSLIKSSVPAVYYCGQNGKRYFFPDEKVYSTWYANFRGVRTISDAAMAAIPLGGSVTYRPGVRLVKIQSDPKTYAVARGGTLRWITSESRAALLYGVRWFRNIDVVSDSLFATYQVGEPIQ